MFKKQLSNSDLEIGFPHEGDFNKLDRDDDVVLTIEELENLIGC